MHSDRRVIHSMGRHRWQLAICGDDVTASRHLPTADGSTYFTTADFGLTTRDAGSDNCSPERVVSSYCKRADPDKSFDELLARVRTAISEPNTTTREVSA